MGGGMSVTNGSIETDVYELPTVEKTLDAETKKGNLTVTLVNSFTKDDAVVWSNNVRDFLCFASLEVIVLKAKRTNNEDCWILSHLTTTVLGLLELNLVGTKLSVRTYFSRHVDN